MNTIHSLSPAKVNLTLRVYPRRADGFHDLDSVVVPLGFGDDVALEKAEVTALEIAGDGVALGAMPEDIEQNLAVRAVRLLEAEVGYALPTRITIRKRIPLGGGLGGGSSNAGTVLRLMNTLWDLGISRERLAALGAQLGSDVALFVMDGTVHMTGRGDRVERLPMTGAQPLWVILVNCGCACPTGRVYGAFDKEGLTSKGDLWDNLSLFLRSGDTKGVGRLLVNDLQAPCFKAFPEVERCAEALRSAGCREVLLSGSGATVFGLVGSREEGERILQASTLEDYWRVCTQTLPDGVMAAHGPLTPIVMVRIHVGQPAASER